MSGGSYNRVYLEVEEMLNNLEHVDSDPRRAAFKKLLILVAKAMHDIDFVDSFEYIPGDDHEAIDAVFAFLGNGPDNVKKAASYDSLKQTLENFFRVVDDRETPLEKAEKARRIQLETLAANKELCRKGLCIHVDHLE